MGSIEVTGYLICTDLEQARIVARYLPSHIELTRAEAGCLDFQVNCTADPLVWTVFERFKDYSSYEAHQERMKSSQWARATAHIQRKYQTRLMGTQ